MLKLKGKGPICLYVSLLMFDSCINIFYLYSVYFSTEEFMGHNADVKCLGIGHKSGRVMVTGGDDRKVNLWSVGKPNCIMVRKIDFIKIFVVIDHRFQGFLGVSQQV